jgi:hypothetical protein
MPANRLLDLIYAGKLGLKFNTVPDCASADAGTAGCGDSRRRRAMGIGRMSNRRYAMSDGMESFSALSDVELDQAIAELLGVEPEISWHVLSPDESSTVIRMNSRQEAEYWLLDHLSRIPDSFVKDYHVGSWNNWPLYSTDIRIAFRLAESMEKLGMWLKLASSFAPKDSELGRLWNAGFTDHGVTGWNGRPDYHAQATTAARAIAESALSALTEIKPRNRRKRA